MRYETNRERNFGLHTPATDFARTQSQLNTLPFYIDVDLSASRSHTNGSALVVNFTGNSIYVDQRHSSGNASLTFQDTGERPTPIFVQAGFIARLPFTFFSIENDAQPGKTLRVIYGVDVEFSPGTGAGVNVLNAIDQSDYIGPACRSIYQLRADGVGSYSDILVAGVDNHYGIRVRTISIKSNIGGVNIPAGDNTISVYGAPMASPDVNISRSPGILLGTLYVAVPANTAASGTVFETINKVIPAGWSLFKNTVCAIGALTESVIDYELLTP